MLMGVLVKKNLSKKSGRKDIREIAKPVTHLDYIPVKEQRKHMLLSSLGRHSAQLCSVRWEIFTGGFFLRNL